MVAGAEPSLALRHARSGQRLRAVMVMYLVITLALGWRLIDIQVRSADHYRAMARRQTERDLELPAERGKLYDRTGQPLAVSLPTATVVANPRQLADAKAKTDLARHADRLAEVLDLDPSDIEAKLRLNKGFVYLARQQDRDVGSKITQMDLAGIQVIDEPRRQYPAGKLAAQVVGFAGTDHKGLSGLEGKYDALLAGQAGRMVQQRAPQGLEISSAPRVGEPPIAGTDLVLTLDREIQATMERLLAQAVKNYKADAASAVVLDAQSGEILAMAGATKDDARRNTAVTDTFEPGSVSKLITAAAALEEGVIQPGQDIAIGSSYHIGGKTFSDDHSPHRGTLGDIIEMSSNIGTIKLAERLGPERLYDYLRRFGYGRPTALTFPGEAAGMLAQPAEWSGTSLPTIAIGQGVSATLLQVAQVYATVARGGVYRDPVLVRGSIDSDGDLVPAATGASRRIITERSARLLSEMLVRVVTDGTGKKAAVEGYDVAGKTGTAQKPGKGGYEPGAYVGSFVGFAPAEQPEVVVAVSVDEPRKGSYYGAETAGPVFSELLRFVLGHRRVPPTDGGAFDDPAEPQV